jgi:hypothetical protein
MLLPTRQEETMSQIHRRFTDEQVKVLFQGYCQGQLARTDLQDLLGIGKSRFFALLKAYRQDPEGFTIAYRRSAPAKLSSEVEEAIKAALFREKAIVEDPDLPISSYNYTAIRDRLQAMGLKVSVTTIIDRAKTLSTPQKCGEVEVPGCRSALAEEPGMVYTGGASSYWSM